LNARPGLAAELDLGLHLPARHPPLAPTDPARRRLHGRSAHDEREAMVAVGEGASYIVLGTIYPTPSKPGHPGSGSELLRRVAPRVAPLPVYAIGGVVVSRIPRLLHAGAYGVAVCGAILAANDPQRVAQAMALGLEVTVHAIEG
jgi:thiamine-phosphate pyrophosphorylase